MNAFEAFKYIYSTLLLIFCVVIVMGLIFTSQTTLSEKAHPAAAFVALWVAVIWLTMVEGGQGSLVGLAPVHKSFYQESHKKTVKSTDIVHKGDNLDRYLMGRQLMVVLIVFIINYSGGPVAGASLWNFPATLQNIFLTSGVAMTLLTAMIGQLNSQVNGSHCMLDYIDNYFALFTVWVAMAIEFSGILHVCYLMQIIVSKLAGKPVESQEPPRDTGAKIFFWARVLLSTCILGISFAVTLGALFQGRTTMWQGVPKAVSVILFFVLLGVVGLLEGMQIAFFAVAKLPKSERGRAPFAMRTCDILFRGEGRNLPGFMVGRQVCVVLSMFVVARITSLKAIPGEGNIWGVSDGLQNFFNTGLLGAFIVTTVGSIVWQLVASAFPIAFLSNPLVYVFLRWCLFLEWTGICSGAWVLAWIHKKIAGFQRDEVYIGTAEERAAKGPAMQDNKDELHLGPGHMLKLPGFAENAPDALKELMMSRSDVREFMSSIVSGDQPPKQEGEEDNTSEENEMSMDQKV